MQCNSWWRARFFAPAAVAAGAFLAAACASAATKARRRRRQQAGLLLGKCEVVSADELLLTAADTAGAVDNGTDALDADVESNAEADLAIEDVEPKLCREVLRRGASLVAAAYRALEGRAGLEEAQRRHWSSAEVRRVKKELWKLAREFSTALQQLEDAPREWCRLHAGGLRAVDAASVALTPDVQLLPLWCRGTRSAVQSSAPVETGGGGCAATSDELPAAPLATLAPLEFLLRPYLCEDTPAPTKPDSSVDCASSDAGGGGGMSGQAALPAAFVARRLLEDGAGRRLLLARLEVLVGQPWDGADGSDCFHGRKWEAMIV
eukprot:TRINITY_DN22443_c0_g1_i2.p1 TRINITY_DN22443_c0_g1~~TRINITY_DN22443_c0_g1_i2.p1  ORF type:complete len:321 (+),score=83.14 TRINITY_DN22443_c0_g1_i2:101-1063(+)